MPHVEANSKEELVKWAQSCPADPGDVIGIRQIWDEADFETKNRSDHKTHVPAMSHDRRPSECWHDVGGGAGHPNTPGFSFTEAVSFMIACADQAEIDRLWAALAPMAARRLAVVGSRTAGARAMEAMTKMIKINISELERAADGA